MEILPVFSLVSCAYCREAAFKLDEFESARDAFKKAQELGAPASKCKLWLQKCQAELEGICFRLLYIL